MYPGAFSEATRVLAKQGWAIFNFHFPSKTYDEVLTGWKKGSWKSLARINRPFRNKSQIIGELKEFGLEVKKVSLNKAYEPVADDYVEYWEVDAKKP